ncbi:XTP/dITP diphosphohydrolase [Alteribacillus persepolensis]|uniref:dITP/XTP pyrophosphatase n=1 Tax=Alteribacillus persepolensis TaxID=568899 RepID=A0A1G8BPR4_9BACI|nr:XTP/dITP diphosphatase [Alteribacillus persepolensis]SDH35185.1 XTP/dITP diphosphohydrolase [Alteribacillus persepolensis]
MQTITVASKNPGKIKEFRDMLEPGIHVQSLLDISFNDIAETGQTFEENASLKAEAVLKELGTPAIADDSGLEIDALDGRPGIYSARYAGLDKDDDKNIAKVLDELKGVPAGKRTARFVCVIAVAAPEKTYTFRGTCEGRIAFEKAGGSGFGYDPIFYLPERDATMAEIPPEEKNRISHRFQALKQLQKQWNAIF